MVMAPTQTLVQLHDAHLAALDQRAAQTGRSRSHLIREAIERFVHDELEAEIDHQYVEAYTRCPPEEIWGDWSAGQMVAAENW